jgi:hypothetical protein
VVAYVRDDVAMEEVTHTTIKKEAVHIIEGLSTMDVLSSYRDYVAVDFITIGESCL